MTGRPVTAVGPTLRLPFVGRQRELAVFADAVGLAMDRRGAVLIFEGEQGCGKSRLLDELAESCARSDTLLLEGRAFDADGTPPFWIWRAPLAQLDRASATPATAPSAGLGAIPELAAVRDGRAPTGHLARDQLVVFDALERVFVAASEVRPIVILLDDLHWADMASLGFLAYLARNIARCAIVVVATWCPEISTNDAAGLLAAAARSATTIKVSLPPLTAADVATMLPGALSDVAASRLVDATGGNAFLITELARQAEHVLEDDPLPVPASVRSIVDARLASLSSDAKDVLEAASVLGRRGTISLLGAVVDRSAFDVAAAADAARVAGLLNEGGDGTFSFRHALVRQAIAGRLTASKAATLHLACARALQRSPAVDDHWAVAHHLTMASRVHDNARGDAQVAWQSAARMAAAMGAHADATAHLEEAVSISSPQDRPALVVDLGWATLRSGRPVPALEHFAAAARDAAADVLADAALGYEDAYLVSATIRLRRGDPSIELLTRAIAAQEPGAAAEASLAAALARAHWYSGDIGAARHWLARADDTLQPDDIAGRMRTAFAHRILAGAPGDAARLADACTVLGDAATASGRHDVAADALRQRVLALVELGDLDAADDEIERLDRLVHQRGEVQYLPYPSLLRAMRMLQRGEFQAARRFNQRAAVLGKRIDSLHMAQLTLMQQFTLNRWTGTPGRFGARLLRHAGPTGSNTIWYAAAALDEAEDGRDADARQLLRRGVGPTGVEQAPVNEFWLFSLCVAALASARVGDTERAGTIHTLLGPYVEFVVGNVAPIVGPISYAAGLSALTAGRHAEAVELFAHAGQRAERLQCWPWVVDALRGEHRAREAAGRDHRGCADRAEALARRLGMTAMAAGPPSDGVGSHLTPREREVLTLVAAGATNQEIADRLYISYRTAKTHVSHVLTKLGARDRAEAAIIARTARLDDPGPRRQAGHLADG